MAQPTASSTLATAPSIVGQLITEPPIATDDGPVVHSMPCGVPDLGEVINAGAGTVRGAATGIIAGQYSSDMPVDCLIPPITAIVQAARSGVVVPRDQIARLAVNSPEFYCAVGAGGVIDIPVASPPHVIVAQAQRAHRDFPSMWYVDLPYATSGQDAQAIRRNRQSMANFRSWSSKKWWEEVNRRFGVADDAIQRARQSKQFAQIACEDMVRMSWLRTIRAPTTIVYSFECDPGELHGVLIRKIMHDWSTVDRDVLRPIEPIFHGMVKAAVAGDREFSHMNNVVMEKYEYSQSTGRTTSYIRLLSFEVCEAVHDIIRGKGDKRSRVVSVNLSLCLYEAIFEAAVWEQFSATLDEDETDILWDYVKGQTITVGGRVVGDDSSLGSDDLLDLIVPSRE